MAKCPKCGVNVEDGAKFCMECGTPIPQTKECPSCHARWPLAAKFCQECGYNFNTAPVTAGGALMGDKNVIAGDVNNSVSMSNSNNTTNVTNNATTHNTTNNVSNTTHNVSNVTNNSQVTNNSTTNNTFIRQEIKQETELDKEAKRVQIEKLRLEKERQEKELARQNVLDEAALETEKMRQAAELEKEKMKLRAVQDEANKSPYSKSTFRKLGLWTGFLGFHYAYIRRWPLFGVTIALMAGMAIFGKPSESDVTNQLASNEVNAVELSAPTKDAPQKPQKTDPVTMGLGLALLALWFGGTFMVTTDANGRKLM